MAAAKVSFTVRRPTPISRSESESEGDFKVPSLPRHLSQKPDSAAGSPLARSVTASPRGSDSSDEDDEVQDELITGFDQFGVQRVNGPKKVPQGPLVIPALKNRDWRELARKRKSAVQYVPPSAAAQTGADGSVGGLGVRDAINSGPVLSGLQIKKRKIVVETQEDSASPSPQPIEVEQIKEETEDQIALRAILAGTDDTPETNVIDIIPTPVSEADAYKQDIDELPESSTLDDYARVPVSQFGAALLRGMGWKEGTAASRIPGKGLVEPYLPAARPALLGIGAKEMEQFDNGDPKQRNSRRPDRRYVPVVKTDGDGNVIRESEKGRDRDRDRRRERSPSRSNASSRRNSRSPDGRRDHRRDYDRRDKRDTDKRDTDRRDYDRRRDYDDDRHRRRGSSRDSERRKKDH